MNNSLIVFMIMTTSLTSMGYYQIIAAKLHEVTGLGLYSQSISLALFLIGLAFGGVYHFHLNKKDQNINYTLLLKTELVVSLITPLCLIFASVFASYYLATHSFSIQSTSKIPVLSLFLIYIPFALVLGFFSGLQLPIFFRHKTNNINTTLFLNYLGALVAGPMINYFLDNQIIESNQVAFLFLFNVSNILILNFYLKKKALSLYSLFIVFVISFFSYIYPTVHQTELSINYFGHNISKISEVPNLINVSKKFGKIERYTSPYQKIDIVTETPTDQNLNDLDSTLYLNRKPQFSLYDYKVYHDSMVEGAINLNGSVPKKVLILGAGDGILAHMLTKKKEIQSIVQIELDPKIVELSTKHPILSLLNENFYLDNHSKYQLIIGDAISYLRNSSKKFDAIFIDFPFPFSAELLKLYSYEFYKLIENSLSANGFFILDFPTFNEASKRYSVSWKILNSIKKVGYSNPFIFGSKASFIFASKSKTNINFDYKQLPENLSWASLFNLAPINHFYKGEYTNEFYSLFYSH